MGISAFLRLFFGGRIAGGSGRLTLDFLAIRTGGVELGVLKSTDFGSQLLKPHLLSNAALTNVFIRGRVRQSRPPPLEIGGNKAHDGSQRDRADRAGQPRVDSSKMVINENPSQYR